MSQNTADKSQVKVLVIESEKVTRIGIKYALRENPNIKIAGSTGSAEEAFYLIDYLQPDVVLIDIVHMGLNGIETTLKIKENRPDAKIIILSPHKSDDEIIASLGAGANAFCIKDMSFDSLLMVIQTVAKGACWIDPSAAAAARKCFQKTQNITNLQQYKAEKERKKLTPRELEVLRCIVDGLSNQEIAEKLFVSVHTSKAHVCNIFKKLGVEDRVLAAVIAIREHLI